MKGGRCTMKKIQAFLLSAVCFLAAVLPAAAQQSVTITLKDNTTRTFTSIDSVRLVGGNFGDATGIGIKIYVTGATQSEDFLYSQMLDLVMSGQTITVDAPVITPDGGEFTQATTVTITCPTAGATIYYTTDGTTPSATHGTLYTAPITISETTTLKAIAVKDGVSSTVTTATFTITIDNNVNANWHSVNWQTNTGNMTYTPKSAGFWRLEFPHISDKTNTSWVQKETSEYGVTFALEWDNDLVSNRWTCYQMHAGNMLDNVDRDDDFKEDPDLPSQTRSTLANYKSSGFSRGHLCPSADRLCSLDQNHQTFYLSNMQPQWQTHNGAQWANLEGDVRKWAEMSTCDTLYVVKAATIDSVTLNGEVQTGLHSYLCNDRLIVPKYFYMALLSYEKSTNTYQAMGIWTYHYELSSEKLNAEYITIDELERRTGLDFFCNLPDDIEQTVEGTLDTTYWSAGAALNR